jgi:hypothetical protein
MDLIKKELLLEQAFMLELQKGERQRWFEAGFRAAEEARRQAEESRDERTNTSLLKKARHELFTTSLLKKARHVFGGFHKKTRAIERDIRHEDRQWRPARYTCRKKRPSLPPAIF